MCTEEQHNQKMEALHEVIKLHTPREPLDATEPITALLSWTLDYKERKHVFIWVPTTTTLSFDDYGSGSVQGQVWTNLGMRPGISITAPNAGATPVMLKIRCTDEIVP
jgi:hypothetical protein